MYEQAKNNKLGHAYIIGGDNDEIVKEIVSLTNAHYSEQYFLDDCKVESIRKIKQNLLCRPLFGEKKVVVIRNAGLLSIAAQNSLLKILEEPPIYAIILLFCEKDDLLLPTIKSRCQLVRIDYVKRECNIGSFDEIKKMNLVQKFKFAEKAALIEDIDSLLNQWLDCFHKQMLEDDSAGSKIDKILLAKKRINSNANKRLMLENILLDF